MPAIPGGAHRRQEWPARRLFRRLGPVAGRGAAHGVGDQAVDQRQPVVRTGLIAPGGEAQLQQRAVEQHAGVVAGERPPGAVGACPPGGEADDQQPRGVLAEGGDRIVEPARLAGAVLLPIGDQPRTERTAVRRFRRRFRPAHPAPPPAPRRPG